MVAKLNKIEHRKGEAFFSRSQTDTYEIFERFRREEKKFEEINLRNEEIRSSQQNHPE